MRIRRLELQGFKSFADRTVFRLSAGICAVVGPNGCGKSNVVDALRWTLGEQSVGTLRGRAMEDVIFAGSDGRPQASRAEVLVVFDNTDGRFGGELARFAEIEVGRRLHRGGRSEYLINKTPCRLKDITRLFLDTGVGARAYSIIEQGRVAFIVHARPEERRVLIDEVAGINRFKAQRQEAERRLAKTQENLVRAADLAAEMEKQRRSLKAHAERAERYRDLRTEWRQAALLSQLAVALERRLREQELVGQLADIAALEDALQVGLVDAFDRAQHTKEAAAEGAAAVERIREKRAATEAEVALLGQEETLKREELERIRATAPELEAEASEARRIAEKLTAELTRLRPLKEGAREALAREEKRLAPLQAREEQAALQMRAGRAAVEATKAGIVAVMTAEAKAEGAVAGAQRAEVDLRERLDQHDAEGEARRHEREAALVREASATQGVVDAVAARAITATQREEASAARAMAKDRVGQARADRANADRERLTLRARLDSLRELVDSNTDLDDAVRTVLSIEGAGVLGLVADLLPLDSPLIPGLKAAAPDILDAVAIADWDALGAIAPDVPEGVSFLLVGRVDQVSARLTASIVEVETLAQLKPGDGRRLAADGWSTDGVLIRSPGVRSAAVGRLGRRAEVQTLEADLVVANEILSDRTGALARAESARGLVEAAWGEAADQAHQAELGELSARRDRDQARRERAVADQALARAAGVRADLERRRDRVTADRSAASDRLREASSQRAAAESTLQGRREELANLETAASAEAEALRATRARVTDQHRALEMVQRDMEYAAERLSDVERQQRRTSRGLEAVGRRGEALERRLRGLRERAAALHAEVIALADSLDLSRAVATVVAESATVAREERTRVEGQLETARVQRAATDDAVGEVRRDLTRRRRQAAQDFDLDLVPVLDELLRGPSGEFLVQVPAGSVLVHRAQLEDVDSTRRYEREALRLNAAIEHLGVVNMAAPAEFRDVDARWQTLRAGADDLETAVSDLRRAIERIDKETRVRFSEAFDAVRAHFKALYPRLVGGGRAELHLASPGDLLSTGIEIAVQPPGKRLSHLTLLSGGEKAMAAVALLFAIFQVKPSPFCVLDEVDAPLDEANSRRFNDMLRELSAETQFIVITHNRTTMEVADVLHGVTMQDPGVSTTVAVRLDR